MNRRQIFLSATLLFVALAAIEQADWFNLKFSWSRSTTSVSSVLRPMAGEQVDHVIIDRPLTRFLPFLKFGETIHRRTYVQGDPTKPGTTNTSITRTRVWLIGFCSTARYNRIADGPFEKHRQSAGK